MLELVDPREKASRTPPAIRAKSAMAEPKWKLQVEQLMACNCNWGCPCSFDAPPTYRQVRDGLPTRLHCKHVIVPLPRGPPDDEPSRERGEQPVRPRQVDVERHFEPSALL